MTDRLAGFVPSRQRTGRPLRWIAAAGSGLLQFLAFPPVGVGGLVFVSLLPLFWAAYAPPAPGEATLGFRRQFMIGFTSQAVYFIALLHWILFLSNEEMTIPGLMLPALLFTAAYLAVFFGLGVALAGLLERRGGWSPAVTLPVLWTLLDHLRGVGVLAFPWGSLGYALARHPAAIQFSAWTGFWAVTFWILAVNGTLYAVWRAAAGGDRRGTLLRGAAGVFLVAVPWGLGIALLAQAPPTAQETGKGMTFALLQANTSREIKWDSRYEDLVVDDLLERTRHAAGLDPDLIVWPETAAPVLLFWNPDLAAKVRDTVMALRRWVLVGTLDSILLPGGILEDHNAAVLYEPTGRPVQRYYKSRLVPFSETMPFRKQIPWITRLNFGQSDFTPGREQTLFRAADWRFTCLICFESIFPDMSRGAVRSGAQYLVNITNDFWFGRSAGPVQHAEMAIHRAVENRTPLVRCANSGISFFVDPYGRVFGETGLFVEAYPTARLVPGSGGSFYTRHGEWFTYGLLILVLLPLSSLLPRRGPRDGARRGIKDPADAFPKAPRGGAPAIRGGSQSR